MCPVISAEDVKFIAPVKDPLNKFPWAITSEPEPYCQPCVLAAQSPPYPAMVPCISRILDEQHYIRGLKKMKLRCSLALCVMLAMALGRIKEKQKDYIRSLVKAA